MTDAPDMDEAAALAADASGGDASEWAGAADAAADAAGDAGEAAASEVKSVGGALLHTSPDADPRAVSGPEPFGHFVVGMRKFLDARGADAGAGDGTPAFIDFARALFGAVLLVRGLSTDAAGGSERSRADDDDDDAGGSVRPPGAGGGSDLPATVGPDMGPADE